MRIFNGFEQSGTITRPIVTIGSYDGVHRGHREILTHIRSLARQRGGESVVVTFHPHPRMVLGSDHSLQLLNTLPEKLELLEAAGIDHVIIVPFTETFSRLSAEAFVREYLVGKLHADTLMVGYNHHLGHNQDGNPHSLESLAQAYGFRLEAMPQQRLGEEKISSTVIRSLIAAGQMGEAARYLDAPYPLTGTLTAAGDLSGIEPVKLLPPEGRYPVAVHFIESAAPGISTGQTAMNEEGVSSEPPSLLHSDLRPPLKFNCEAVIGPSRAIRMIPGQSLSDALSGFSERHSRNIRLEFE